MPDSLPEEEMSQRLNVLNERQREIQRALYGNRVGEELEIMVEAENPARGQWIGRASDHKTVNFNVQPGTRPVAGSYGRVKVTKSYPNSLVGDLTAVEKSLRQTTFLPVLQPA